MQELCVLLGRDVGPREEGAGGSGAASQEDLFSTPPSHPPTSGDDKNRGLVRLAKVFECVGRYGSGCAVCVVCVLYRGREGGGLGRGTSGTGHRGLGVPYLRHPTRGRERCEGVVVEGREFVYP